jgi:CTP synthase
MMREKFMKKNQSKIIFVTGGVLSSLGKGITSASISALLKNAGQKVSMLKIDPYINVDPGTMSPKEHGEVFVTADGAETDLDLGNYERFLDTTLSKDHNFTTGQVYQAVIDKERRGDYLGQTIQVIPHIVDEIKDRILKVCKNTDILVVELGGTVGDIEGLPYLEAIREIKQDLGKEHVMNIHVTLIPFIKVAGELKTKPTQHSIQELRRIGITPHMLICRTEQEMPSDLKKKLAMSCDIDKNSVIEARDASTIYEVPMHFLKQDVLKPISAHLGLKDLQPNMDVWNTLVKGIKSPRDEVKIAFVGKYLYLKESYKSLIEALIHSGANLDTKVDIKWVDSEDLSSENAQSVLGEMDGVLVPGGFGERGINGKIEAIKFARENKIPFLGICLGMQLAIVEFARNVLGLEDANSIEFDKETKNPVIYLIDEFIATDGSKQIRTHKSPMGGTLRLGSYPCETKDGSNLRKAYGVKNIEERHRHRYEANPKYKEEMQKAGMSVTGESNGLIEVVEIPKHPWFVGVQFHPEFTSHLVKPNPIIFEFVKKANEFSQEG